MKRLFLILTALLLLLPAGAQEVISQQEYLKRYNNLVQRVGVDGVGVETLLNKWEATYPEDAQQKIARFSFCFERSRTAQVIRLDKDRYLGLKPLLPMTDSLGNRCNFFQDYVYDDELFAEALRAIDQAIASKPDRLDFRFAKADALIAYEKEQPEMALQELMALTDRHFKLKPVWVFEGMDGVSPEQFNALMQDYCILLFKIGSATSAEAFRTLSQHLLTYCKSEPLFLNNLGSYYLVKKDYKNARKYFDQVLKKHPGDMTALRNCILMARSQKDTKLEKKYLSLMAENGENQTDRESARIRLEAFGKK